MKLTSLILIALGSASTFAADPLNLSRLSAVAVKEHPRIKSMVAERSAVDARRQMALVPFRPRLSLNGYGGVGNGSMIFPSSVEPINYATLPNDGVGVANATFMWKLFSFGRDGFEAQAGDARLRSSDLAVETETQDVILGLRSAFAEALYQQDRTKAYEAALESAQEVERVTQARFDAGKVPEAFRLRAQADTAKAAKELAMARADAAGALARLWDSAGLDEVPEGGAGDWDTAFSAPATLKDAIQAGLDMRPEYLALVEDRKASVAKTAAISRSRMPDLNFMAMDDQMANTGMNGRNGFKAGLILSFPVGDGGERRAAGQEARAETAKVEASMKAVRNRIVSEVTSAWAQWTASDPVTQSATAELAASDEAYKVALLRYEDGKAILAELTDARAQLTLAHLAVAEAAEYHRKAWSNLARSTGATTPKD